MANIPISLSDEGKWFVNQIKNANDFISELPEIITRQFDNDGPIHNTIKPVMNEYRDSSINPLTMLSDSSSRGEITPSSPMTSTEGENPAGNILSSRSAGESRVREDVVAMVEEYDPSHLELEQVSIQEQLDNSLTNHLNEANSLFDKMLRSHEDNPAIQADIEVSRQTALSNIKASHKSSSLQLNSNFARFKSEGRERHDQGLIAREQSDIQIESMRLDNELKRLQLENPEGTEGSPFFLAPSRGEIEMIYNQLTIDSDPLSDINEDEARVLDAIAALANEYQYGVAVGDPSFLSPDRAGSVLADLKDFTGSDQAAIQEIIRQLTLGAQQEASKLRS